jgi:hypothetical protein
MGHCGYRRLEKFKTLFAVVSLVTSINIFEMISKSKDLTPNNFKMELPFYQQAEHGEIMIEIDIFKQIIIFLKTRPRK